VSSELQRASLFFKYVREENLHHHDVLERGKSEMLSALKHVRVDPNASRPPPAPKPAQVPPELPPDETAPDAPALGAELKKLYRKIVQETHPDKVSALGLGQKEVDRRSKLYKRVIEAFKKSEEDVLVEAALDLDIDTGLDETRVAESLRKRATILEKEIKAIKGSVEWYWVHASEEDKIRVIKEICNRNGWIYVTDEQIAEGVRFAIGVHPGSREEVQRRARQKIMERRKTS
jgi:hypothetical protein